MDYYLDSNNSELKVKIDSYCGQLDKKLPARVKSNVRTYKT